MKPQQAFTLIEALVAITIGSLVLLTAMTGLRVVSQTVTLSNRQSLENSLVRTGYLAALEDLDLWTSYDDPFDGNILDVGGRRGGERLRSRGLQFHPMKDTFAKAKLPVSADDPRPVWDPVDPWAAHDPKTWWRGNPAEHEASKLAFGRYGIFANTHLQPALTTTPNGAIYGSPPVRHTWSANRMATLKEHLGYYALAEYMPANALYAYYTSCSGSTNHGGIPDEMIHKGKFRNDDGLAYFPQGIYRCTKDSSYAIVPLDQAVTMPVSGYTSMAKDRFDTGQYATVSGMANFRAMMTSRPDFMAARPESWPTVQYSTARFITHGRFACVARVHWVSPISGQAAEISFTGIGTTLRGARQQRSNKPGGGWAQWDNDGVDHRTDPAYQHLDSP